MSTVANGHARHRTYNSDTGQSSLEYEMEQLSISCAKAATQIFEELGTQCPGVGENDDGEVHGGAPPYESIDDVNSVMTLGDSLSRTCWGTNAKDNRAYYIADTGHIVTVKPRDEKNPNEESVLRVQKFLDLWMKENDWKQRQTEVSHRLDRHGEGLDLLYYEPEDDGILRLTFGEPTDLKEDPNSDNTDTQDTEKEFIDIWGVRRTNDLRYRPVAYFLDEQWYDDLRFKTRMGALPDLGKITDRTLVQHRKRNVLASDPRGVMLYWPVREEMTFASRLLANMVRVSSFQAAFGAIRTIGAQHGADAVKSYLSSLSNGKANAGTGERFDFPAAGVVTVPESVDWDFPETGRGTSNTVEVLVQALRACSSGMKLPEFMLTANVSEGNFASTLVSEGPFHKGMRYEQSLMVTEDERILWQAIRYAASRGVEGLTEEDVDNVVLETKPPRVQTRNRQEDFEVNKALWEIGELSGKTLLATEGHDRKSEQAEKKVEIKNELPLPAGSPNAKPGPVAGPTGDPLKEKGVLAGEPTDDPELRPDK